MEGIERLKKVVRFPGSVIAILILVFVLSSCAAPTPTPISVKFLLDEKALENKEVRVLCYAPGPLNSFQFQERITVTTDSEGIAALPAKCTHLAALYQLHEQPSWHPSLGPAYRVYATSWEPGSSTPTPVTSEVKIVTDQKLTVFDVVVSLEWEPVSKYIFELETGLNRASEYLYDLTDGQMVFGELTVYTGGEHWNNADLRILAANDQRPNAFIGGIVAARRSYTSPITGMETDYVPGRVLMGRYWDGLDAFDPDTGNWSMDPAYRTWVHEWAHYALFQNDEYIHLPEVPAVASAPSAATGAIVPPSALSNLQYCTCNNLPGGSCVASVMAYHYTATEFWHPDHIEDPSGVCTQSIQWYVHGESDWETLARWGDIQGLPDLNLRIPLSLRSGPGLGLAGDLFEFIDLSTAPSGVTNRTIVVEVPDPDTFGISNIPASHVYLLKGTSPDRILHQGSVPRNHPEEQSLGQVDLLDTEAATAWISVDRYALDIREGARYNYFAGVTDGETVTVGEDSWNASLDLVYRVTDTGTDSRLTALTVILSSPQELKDGAIAQLCFPDESLGCPTLPDDPRRIALTSADGMTWTGTFEVSSVLPGKEELPPYGVVLVRGLEMELIRWYQDAGPPGPAHMGGDAPLRDGHMMVDIYPTETFETTEGPEPEQLLALPLPKCSGVYIMPAADYNAVNTSLNTADVSIQGIVGTPLDIDIMIPENHDECDNPGINDRTLPDTLTAILTMFYPITQTQVIPQQASRSQRPIASLQPELASVSSLEIPASQLRIVRFDRESCIEACRWEMIGNVDNDQNLGWVAAQIEKDGIYAIVWVTATQ